MKADNLAVLALIVALLLFLIPYAINMDNETVITGLRIAAVLCFALCCGLTLRHFLLPKETVSETSKEPISKGHTVIGVSGDQIAVTDGDVTQINQAPEPSCQVSSETGWQKQENGKFSNKYYLNIENAFNSNGLRFTVSGDGVEEIDLFTKRSGMLGVRPFEKILNRAIIECDTPNNIGGISVISSKNSAPVEIKMDVL